MLSHGERRGRYKSISTEIRDRLESSFAGRSTLPTFARRCPEERGGGTGSPNLPTSPPSAAHAATDTAAGLSRRSRTPPSSPSLPALPPRCPAHPGGLFSCPARANPRLGVSRASRFLVLRKEEQGVGVGQQRQQTGGVRAVQRGGGPHREDPRQGRGRTLRFGAY